MPFLMAFPFVCVVVPTPCAAHRVTIHPFTIFCQGKRITAGETAVGKGGRRTVSCYKRRDGPVFRQAELGFVLESQGYLTCGTDMGSDCGWWERQMGREWNADDADGADMRG
jgi:hypothetical protein